MSLSPAWLEKAEGEGWSIEVKAVSELDDTRGGGYPGFIRALLNADLKVVGKPFLPDDINRADSRKLAGPHVLQVVSAADVAQPSKFAEADKKGRILRIRMTDGKASCVGVEFQPLPQVSTEQLMPGTKVRLRGCALRVGVILLDPKCLEVLGGRVEALAEGWEMQQRFGGTGERGEEQGVERPPPFRHFDAEDAALAARKPSDRRGVLPSAVAAAQADHEAVTRRGVDGGRGSAGAVQGPQRAGAPVAGGGSNSIAGRAGRSGQEGTRAARAARQAQQGRPRRGFQPYQPPAARQPPEEAEEAPLPGREPGERAGPHGAQRAQHVGMVQSDGTGRVAKGEGMQPPPATAAAGKGPDGVDAATAAGAPAVCAAAHAPGFIAAGPAGGAARQKLLGRLAASDAQGGRYGGRGRGGGRRGRRSRGAEDEDDGSMTLEEWEARQKAANANRAGGSVSSGPSAPGAGSRELTDEELAWQLQRQLDMEDALEGQTSRQPPAADLAATLFNYGPAQQEPGRGGVRGRGGGRGRGRRREMY